MPELLFGVYVRPLLYSRNRHAEPLMSQLEMEKLYYSIGEVSEIVGHEPHVLRYWEKEFDVLSPRKNRAGRRVYTEEDVETVERIRHLLKEEKYTIAGARQAIRRGEERRNTKETLKTLRSFLTTLKDQLSDSS